MVNTQYSWQQGSHWFTVVAGPWLGAAEPSPSRPAAEQSHGAAEPSPSRPAGEQPHGAAEPLPSRPAAEQSHPRGHVLDGRHEANDYPALFPNPSAALVQAMALARACSDAGATAAKMKRACEEWDAALADGSYANKRKLRKLCADHDIRCGRGMQTDAKAAARVARSKLTERLRGLRLVAAASSGKEGKPLEEDDTSGKATAVVTLERYLDRQTGAADIPAAPEAVGSNVATDVATVRRILLPQDWVIDNENTCDVSLPLSQLIDHREAAVKALARLDEYDGVMVGLKEIEAAGKILSFEHLVAKARQRMGYGCRRVGIIRDYQNARDGQW